MKKFFMALAIYGLGALTTCGHVAANYPCDGQAEQTCLPDAVTDAYFTSLLWPVYWTFRAGHDKG